MNGSTEPYDGIRAGSAELALRSRGWTGDRLMREARKVAADYITAHVPYMGDRREDLVSFLVLKALEATLRFDPQHPIRTYGSNGGDHFGSYICDVMEHRCVDWYRSKAEGNGDRRYGNDNRIVLSPMEEGPDYLDEFEELVRSSRLRGWNQALTPTGLSLVEFVAGLMDTLAEHKRLDRFSKAAEQADVPFFDFIATAMHRAAKQIERTT